MKLALEKLPGHLEGKLAPLYVISGDDPLLTIESADAVRARARAAGFAERETWTPAERGAEQWDALLQSAQSLSLFASRRVLELRLPSGKPGKGAAVLEKLIEQCGGDTLLLVLTGRLEKDAQEARWLKLAAERGVWLPVWPVDAARLPAWLEQRLQAAGLSADKAAIELLMARTEGNLLAARQEIEKLALQLSAGSRVSARDIEACTGESARYSVFQLAAAVEAGDAVRALRLLGGLQSEGTAPTLVLWALVRALHRLRAPRRFSVARLTARAQRSDGICKGHPPRDAWGELRMLAAELCGLRTLPMPRKAHWVNA